MTLPFAYVAYKGAFWTGIIEPKHFTRREIVKWLGEHTADGFTIGAPATHAEYVALIETLEPAGGERAKEKQESLP